MVHGSDTVRDPYTTTLVSTIVLVLVIWFQCVYLIYTLPVPLDMYMTSRRYDLQINRLH